MMSDRGKRSAWLARWKAMSKTALSKGRGIWMWGMLVVGLYALFEHTPVGNYVDALKQSAVFGTHADSLAEAANRYEDGTDDPLLQKILAEAERLREDPVNAKVDPVWKAIPGYNGIEIDIEKTLQANKGRAVTDELTYIMRETEPDVQLEDLGAYPIYKGNPKKKMVAFMVNVAWGDEYLPGMLETFRKEGVPATFFFDGSWLSKHIETAKAICEEGFECSNHAYSHPAMSRLSRKQQAEEIMRTERLLQEELGVQNKWFAPPSGDYNQTTVEVALEMGLRTVLWTLDTVDWKNPGPDWIIRRISARLEPGSLILMHPTSSSSEALAGLINTIRARGYAFGTVSELLSSRRVHTNAGKR